MLKPWTELFDIHTDVGSGSMGLQVECVSVRPRQHMYMAGHDTVTRITACQVVVGHLSDQPPQGLAEHRSGRVAQDPPQVGAGMGDE